MIDFTNNTTGFTNHNGHGRLFGFGSREEIYLTHRGIDLLAQIDPSGLWREVLLQLTAWTVNHEDSLGRRRCGGDSRLVVSQTDFGEPL